jgi:hypothetical protein
MVELLRPFLLRICILLGLWTSIHSYGYARVSPCISTKGPSFSCIGNLGETEAAICSDGTLAAYDRAMSWAYARGWHSIEAEERGQSSWLAQRNNCAGRKDCIFEAYHRWISALAFERAPPSNFERTGPVDIHVGEPANGRLRARKGSLAQLDDWGALFVQPIGGNWFLFRATATHAYDPRDELGPNVSTGDVTGLVHLSKATGVWVPYPHSPGSCEIRLTRMPSEGWWIDEVGYCSGIGAKLTGQYHRIS